MRALGESEGTASSDLHAHRKGGRGKEEKERKQNGRLHLHFSPASFADISFIASARSFWMRERTCLT